MGLVSKADRGRNGLDTSGASLFGNNQSRQFDRLNTILAMTAPPPVKFKDLKTVVDIKMRYTLLPFDVRVDFIRASSDTAIVPVTLQVANRDLSYVSKNGVQHASVNIYGQVTTLSGKIMSTFEEPLRLDIPAELLEKSLANVSLYQQPIPLRPGRYRLDLVLKDVNSGKMGTLSQSLTVPDYSNDDKLSVSSLVLADLVEPVPARDTGSGPFILGSTRIRPRVPSANGGPATFSHGQKVNVWMQVYNLAIDKNTGKPSARVEYHLTNAAGQSVYDSRESPGSSRGADNQITAQKALPSEKLDRGEYQVTIGVADLISGRSISATAKFAIQ
jgi:hypothetical protein